jgi:predicted deacylase
VLDIPQTYKEEIQYQAPLENMTSYFALTGGLVEYHQSPGVKVNKGSHLATIYRPYDHEKIKVEIRAQKDSIIIYHGRTSNISEGVELFHVMEEPVEINK